ncbi:hypothetical protein CWRG_01964 [Chthonomonas calidirosea]|uniref:Uncharacterized protein n=1 Tax=Chthonomonas calidirosea (strain DSM 23976 / ICMP 18418 / T49) TaxID=1303518 RepID=S0EZL8_CHTCT|nr:hypothetical protein [Chthonomonas calidirosea]CCW35918.1 hypothetical protein CCALI_02111 [Chthonomonas calidirosea T49]CEK17827.1 hypothetical protein CWRG_01964 [Chthonomonas calidirosea]CEK17828.1 hypothetical protein CP488_01979 [Chthonomonas calidirosea]CEK18861.1 hypothetical protein CTKA_01983 [Chthonomonas calidirosea]
MSTRDRNLLILAVVLILAAAGFMVYAYRKNQPQVVKSVHVDPNSFPKVQWMKEHKAGVNPNAPESGAGAFGTPQGGTIQNANQ